jgi:archaemetzincin
MFLNWSNKKEKYNHSEEILFGMKIFNLLFVIIMVSGCKPNYFDSMSKNDIFLSKPKEGEWRYEHNEKLQSFEDFRESRKIKAVTGSDTIYIFPIGQFNDLQSIQIKLIKHYLELFYQLPVDVAQGLDDSILPNKAKRMRANNNEQLLAPFILDSILTNKKPKHSIALMALTSKDLYPKPEWNFVFGLASYTKGVGVSSIYRLQDSVLTESNFKICLKRILNICSHEIGHMFGIHHCLHASCVMNGSNSLAETDRQTLRLCSNCQRKLQSTVNFNPEKRLTQLASFFKVNGLIIESKWAENDLLKLKD